jgi:hypothetical protein
VQAAALGERLLRVQRHVDDVVRLAGGGEDLEREQDERAEAEQREPAARAAPAFGRGRRAHLLGVHRVRGGQGRPLRACGCL